MPMNSSRSAGSGSSASLRRYPSRWAAEIVRVRGTGIEELAGHERQYAKRAVELVDQVDEYLARIHGLGLPR